MTTRDIIKRAEQFANKENADFYSYAEKVAMLNESWNSLYQYLCNTGDKYWVKKTLFNKTIELPQDCYQVSAVYKKESGKEKQIYNYTLCNNVITVKEDFLNPTYVLEYYPVPITLNYKDTIKKCPFQMNGMVDMNNNKILIRGESYYSVYDIVTKTSHQIPVSALSCSTAHIYDDNTIVFFTGTNYTIYRVSEKIIVDDIASIVVYNNCIYYFKAGIMYDSSGKNLGYAPITYEMGCMYKTDDFETFTKVEGQMYVSCGNSLMLRTDSGDYYKDKNVGLDNDTRVYTENAVTGYYDTAFLTKDSTFNVYYVESSHNDTIINYPNNIFYTFLALDIALKMRSKQGVDNEQLNSQWQLSKNALFNSITKNKGNHVTVKDVYEYDWIGGIYY